MKKSVIVGLILATVIIIGALSINSVRTISGTQDSSLNENQVDSQVVSNRAPAPGHEDVEEMIVDETNSDEPGSPIEIGVPTRLSMPFNIEDIDSLNGELNPLGVVRFDQDREEIGHSGIDIPLKQDSPIYAVADGPVVLIGSTSDPWNGMKVFQLLRETEDGEGWAFIYEHIEIANGVIEGSELKRGDLVGTKIAPEGFTVHLQLSKIFNNYEFISDIQCWPNFLSAGEKGKLDSWWKGYRETEHLIDSWRTTEQEGKFPFKGFLDTTKYPDGLQYCYPLGTDVR